MLLFRQRVVKDSLFVLITMLSFFIIAIIFSIIIMLFYVEKNSLDLIASCVILLLLFIIPLGLASLVAIIQTEWFLIYEDRIEAKNIFRIKNKVYYNKIIFVEEIAVKIVRGNDCPILIINDGRKDYVKSFFKEPQICNNTKYNLRIPKSIELVEFIKNELNLEIKNETNAVIKESKKTTKEKKNVDYEHLGKMLFWFLLLGPILVFLMICIVGEYNIFGIAGIVRYSYIMLFCVLSILFSLYFIIKMKKNSYKYKNNLALAIILLPLCLMIGLSRFYLKKYSYNVDKVVEIQEKVHIEIPTKINIATYKFSNYNISYIKFMQNDQINEFENRVQDGSFWLPEKESPVKEYLLSNIIKNTNNSYDYYLCYNINTNEYNIYPPDGEYEFIFLAYDIELKKMVIVDNYIIKID